MAMFPSIETLQELIKSYTIAQQHDSVRANDLLTQIAALRLEIALDAEGRRIFYEQRDVPFLAAANFSQAVWFSKHDIAYIIRRGIANLSDAVLISAANEGNRQRIITREPVAWQQLFSTVQVVAPAGQQTLFDLPQELLFSENETFALQITGQVTSNGQIFYHGCTLKDTIEDVIKEDVAREISEYVPEGQQLIPIGFRFPSNIVDTPAVSPTGSKDILSAKNSRSVVLTHVSTDAPDTRVTLIDEGRNQLICETVEARGIAATETNKFTTFYELPYPHLLRRGDRLRLRAVNGSLITGDEMAADINYNVCFRGYPV